MSSEEKKVWKKKNFWGEMRRDTFWAELHEKCFSVWKRVIRKEANLGVDFEHVWILTSGNFKSSSAPLFTSWSNEVQIKLRYNSSVKRRCCSGVACARQKRDQLSVKCRMCFFTLRQGKHKLFLLILLRFSLLHEKSKCLKLLGMLNLLLSCLNVKISSLGGVLIKQ